MAEVHVRDEETGEERILEYDPVAYPELHRVLTETRDPTQMLSRPRRPRPTQPKGET